jgi:ribonuclease HI
VNGLTADFQKQMDRCCSEIVAEIDGLLRDAAEIGLKDTAITIAASHAVRLAKTLPDCPVTIRGDSEIARRLVAHFVEQGRPVVREDSTEVVTTVQVGDTYVRVAPVIMSSDHIGVTSVKA